MKRVLRGTELSGPFPLWSAFGLVFFSLVGIYLAFVRGLEHKIPGYVVWLLGQPFVFWIIEWMIVYYEQRVKKPVLVSTYLLIIICFFYTALLVAETLTHRHEGNKFATKTPKVDSLFFFFIEGLLGIFFALGAESGNRILDQRDKKV